jgi:hypothetical protein
VSPDLPERDGRVLSETPPDRPGSQDPNYRVTWSTSTIECEDYKSGLLFVYAGVTAGTVDVEALLPAPEPTPVAAEQKRRGPKKKYIWELFMARFFMDLDNDDVPADGDINFAQQAKKLREWGRNHPQIDEENTPSDPAMRAKVTEWASLWPLLRRK